MNFESIIKPYKNIIQAPDGLISKKVFFSYIKRLSNNLSDEIIDSHTWEYLTTIAISCNTDLTLCNKCFTVCISGYWKWFLSFPYADCSDNCENGFGYISPILRTLVDFTLYECKYCKIKSMGLKGYKNILIDYPHLNCASKLMKDVL